MNIRYLEVLLTESSEIKFEIQTRITAGIRCYHAFIELTTIYSGTMKDKHGCLSDSY
jgi:hypothetical protein